jgi:hypothetical protein
MSVTVGLEISGISTDELNNECYCVVEDLGYIFAMCVTVRLEISGISIDKLRHVCYCWVRDLRYIYR